MVSRRTRDEQTALADRVERERLEQCAIAVYEPPVPLGTKVENLAEAIAVGLVVGTVLRGIF